MGITASTTASTTASLVPSSSMEPEAEPEAEPESEIERESEMESSTGTADKCSSCQGHASGCIWSDGVCYTAVARDVCESSAEHVWCGAVDVSNAMTTDSACGSCNGCMWSNGVCHMDASKSYCETWSDNSWCGGAALAQVQRHGFLGSSLIQERSDTLRGGVAEEL